MEVLVIVVVPDDFIVFIVLISHVFDVTIVVACNDKVVVPDTGKGVVAVVALDTSAVVSVLVFVDDIPGDVVPAFEAVVSFVFCGNPEVNIVIDFVAPEDFEAATDEEVVVVIPDDVIPSLIVVVVLVLIDEVVFDNDFVNTGGFASSLVVASVFMACGDP